MLSARIAVAQTRHGVAHKAWSSYKVSFFVF